MKILGDYHTHTVFSDGHSTLEENVAQAKKIGLEEFVVSDHGFKSVFAGMTPKHFEIESEFVANCDEIKILLGLESNILNPEGDIDTPDEYIRRLDVLLVGFHRFLKPKYAFKKFIFTNGFGSKKAKQKLVDVNTQAYVKVLDKYPIDVLVHLNHMAPVNAKPIFEKAREKGTYVELNAKYLDAFLPLVKDALESGVNFVVGSDAHKSKDIGRFDMIERFVEDNKIPRERVFGMFGNKPVFKNKKNWRKEL